MSTRKEVGLTMKAGGAQRGSLPRGALPDLLPVWPKADAGINAWGRSAPKGHHAFMAPSSKRLVGGVALMDEAQTRLSTSQLLPSGSGMSVAELRFGVARL